MNEPLTSEELFDFRMFAKHLKPGSIARLLDAYVAVTAELAGLDEWCKSLGLPTSVHVLKRHIHGNAEVVRGANEMSFKLLEAKLAEVKEDRDRLIVLVRQWRENGR